MADMQEVYRQLKQHWETIYKIYPQAVPSSLSLTNVNDRLLADVNINWICYQRRPDNPGDTLAKLKVHRVISTNNSTSSISK